MNRARSVFAALLVIGILGSTAAMAAFTFSGNTLTLIDGDELFDLDQDGEDESVIFEGILVRN